MRVHLDAVGDQEGIIALGETLCAQRFDYAAAPKLLIARCGKEPTFSTFVCKLSAQRRTLIGSVPFGIGSFLFVPKRTDSLHDAIQMRI